MTLQDFSNNFGQYLVQIWWTRVGYGVSFLIHSVLIIYCETPLILELIQVSGPGVEVQEMFEMWP